MWCCRPSIYSPDAKSDVYLSYDHLLVNPTSNVEHYPRNVKLIQDLLEKCQIVFDKSSKLDCGAGQKVVKLARIYPAKTLSLLKSLSKKSTYMFSRSFRFLLIRVSISEIILKFKVKLGIYIVVTSQHLRQLWLIADFRF